MRFHFDFFDNLDYRVQTVIKIGCTVIIAAGIIGGGVFAVRQHMKKAAAAKAAEQQTDPYMIQDLSVQDLVGGNFYVKDPNGIFHKIPAGTVLTDGSSNDLPAESPAPENRAVSFTKDESLIPTMYSDSSLVFKTDETNKLPETFMLERYKDAGYSFGVRGLTSDGSSYKYHAKADGVHFDMNSSIVHMKISSGDEVIFDKVGGVALSTDNVSEAGIVEGLTKDQLYRVDTYVGTTYVGLDASADTHMFTSYETYEITDYSLQKDGYAEIKFPSYMWSGYYYVQGMGMIRYINHNKIKGDNNVEYNTPYYLGKDDNGNMIYNPADTPVLTDDNKQDIGAENMLVKSVEKAEDLEWTSELTIDNPQDMLYVEVDYSEGQVIVNGNIAHPGEGAKTAGVMTPSASLVDPSGVEHQFRVNDTDRALVCDVKNPSVGTWIVKMKGMYGRTFRISQSFEGPDSTMIVKNSDAAAGMKVYIKDDLKNGVFKFVWEDTSHAAEIEITNDKGQVIGNKKTPENVLKETYGEIDLNVGELKSGEYKVLIMGESLGHVKFSYTDTENNQDETVSENESSSDEAAAESEPSSEKDNIEEPLTEADSSYTN